MGWDQIIYLLQCQITVRPGWLGRREKTTGAMSAAGQLNSKKAFPTSMYTSGRSSLFISQDCNLQPFSTIYSREGLYSKGVTHESKVLMSSLWGPSTAGGLIKVAFQLSFSSLRLLLSHDEQKRTTSSSSAYDDVKLIHDCLALPPQAGQK